MCRPPVLMVSVCQDNLSSWNISLFLLLLVPCDLQVPLVLEGALLSEKAAVSEEAWVSTKLASIKRFNLLRWTKPQTHAIPTKWAFFIGCRFTGCKKEKKKEAEVPHPAATLSKVVCLWVASVTTLS